MAPTAISDSFPPQPSKIHSTPPPLPTTSIEPEDLSEIEQLRLVLHSSSAPLAHRFRALFSLKHHAALIPQTPLTAPALEAISSALLSPHPSPLIKHELAYCLGQSRQKDAIPPLMEVLGNKREDAMVRHECAEALGAIGVKGDEALDDRARRALEERRDDEMEVDVVKETCEIAIGRLDWEREGKGRAERLRDSDFASIDPAPPLSQTAHRHSIDELQQHLMDALKPLFFRYRAMFALRDLASPPDLPTAVPAVHALASGFKDSSALFRHEIAFVFGQLSHPASIPALTDVLENLKEADMVRHEAAEALGGLGEEEGVEDILRRFLEDKAEIVRDSVVVALDMAEFERSGEREYAVVPGMDQGEGRFSKVKG